MRIHLAQANEVIVNRALIWRIEILADIDAENTVVAGALYVLDQVIDAQVIEAEAIDDAFDLLDAEQAGFWIAGLWPRRNSADFDKAKAQRCQAINIGTILVQPCSKPHRIRKIQPHYLPRLTYRGLGKQFFGQTVRHPLQRFKRQIMGAFGVKQEQQRFAKSINIHEQDFTGKQLSSWGILGELAILAGMFSARQVT